MAALDEQVPELVILVDDLGAPCDDVCRRIREVSRVPVLALCEDDSSEHVARALYAGMDDHVGKETGSNELEARVEALLRRNQLSTNDGADDIRAGPLSLDARRATCSVDGHEVKLTPREFKLLRALASRPANVLSHDQLIEEVWGSSYHGGRENLRKLVQRLRATLGERVAIEAVAGAGYRLDPQRSGYNDAEFRNLVFQVTRRCLSVKGFHDLTVDDICRAVHTNRNVFQRHFASKDALLNDLMQWGNRASADTLLRLAQESQESGVTSLIDYIGLLLGAPTSRDTAQLNLEWWAWVARSEAGLPVFRQTRNEWRNAIALFIRDDLGPKEADATTEVMADLMLVIYYGLVVHTTLDEKDRDVASLIQLIRTGWEGERVCADAPEESPPKRAKPGRVLKSAKAGG